MNIKKTTYFDLLSPLIFVDVIGDAAMSVVTRFLLCVFWECFSTY